MSFLHGVETVELTKGPKSIQVVSSGIIGLVGIAPKGPLNTLTLVQSQSDAVQFGSELIGFSIPQAIAAIQSQGNATVFVVNVFNPSTMTTAVTAESLPVVLNRATKFAFAPVGSAAPTITDTGGSPTYVAGTDYTIDDFGNVTILASTSTIAEGVVLKATYAKLNASAVTGSVIIGTNSGGVRTGFKCFLDAFNQLGAKPKILIAPGYSTINAVAADMAVNASLYKATALIDAPTGTTVSAAITARGPAGTLNFNPSDGSRTILLEPGNLKAFDIATNTTVNRPYSQFYAGVMANNDNVNGYWFSPSNKPIIGVLGSEIAITAAINDSTTEANALNAQGICTVFNSGTSGIRTWGNRFASYPASAQLLDFIPNRRTLDVIKESIDQSMLAFIDLPVNSGLIDAVRLSVQSFMNTLIGRAAIQPGSEITYDASLNSDSEIALGHVTWSITLASPPPLEKATFEYFVDTTLLSVKA